MKLEKLPIKIIISSTFVWLGFILAISFMEAWLKFQAPGVTQKIGSGIGKLVFHALNKVEWILAISILVSIFIIGKSYIKTHLLLFISALIILLIQSFWLLPALDVRVEMIANGENILPSGLHFAYIFTEIIKVISLSIFGFTQLK